MLHTDMQTTEKTTSDQSSRKRRSSSKRTSAQHMLEHFITRHLLKLVALLFMVASLWFAVSSTDTLIRIFRSVSSPENFLTGKDLSSGQEESVTKLPGAVPEDATVPGSFFLILLALAIVWLALQWLSRWRKRTEFQVVSVFFVFTALGLVIRYYGWRVEWLFPLMILFSWGQYISGRHQGHMGSRLNMVFSWGFIILFWLLKMMIEGNRELLVYFFIFIPMSFVSFHSIGLLHGFSGHRSINRRLELVVIILNAAAFYLLITITIVRYYGGSYMFLFTFLICLVYIGTLLLMEWKNLPYRKTPYIMTCMLLVSLLPPLLLRTDQIILFTGSLAALLMIYSRYSKDQPSIIFSLGLSLIMTLFFVKDIVIVYIPALFSGKYPLDYPVFIKGAIGGLFIPMVAYFQRFYLKKLYIRFSHKWFSRRRYMKILKGMFLVASYLGLYWIWQYFFFMLIPVGEGMFINWFIFHCIYYLVVIPWLAYQRSSFLRPVVVTAIVLSLIYPLLLSAQNLMLLEWVVEKKPGFSGIFYLHYLSAAMFVLLLLTILRYRRKTFRELRVMRSVVILYCVLMGLFLVFSETALTAVLISAHSKIQILGIMDRLYHFPSTLILGGMGLALLTTGILKSNRFLRILAFCLILVAAGKIILYDVSGLAPLTRVLWLFLTGTGLLVFSILYARIRRKDRHRRLRHRRTPQSGLDEDHHHENPGKDEKAP